MLLSKKQTQHRFYRWYVVIILALVYASSHVDRQIMGILLQPIKDDLGVSDTQMGFLIGLTFALFYATLGMPIAVLADRTNRRNIITIAVTVWSGMTALCGYAANYVQLAITRIGVAVGEAGSTPPSHSMISDLFKKHERTTAMGIYVAGINVGLLIAYLAGGWLVDNWGWRTTFIVVGLPGLLLALIMITTVIEPKRTDDSEDSDELKAQPPPTFKETLRYMLKVPSLCHVVIGCSLGAFVGYGMVLWVPTFMIRSHGLTATEAGFIMAMLVGIGGGIGTLMAGRMVDFLGRYADSWRAWSVTISQLALLPLGIGFLLFDYLPAAIVCYVLPTMFGAFYLPPSFALIQQLVKPRMRAVASAVTLFLTNIIGLGMGPQAIGFLSDLLAPEYGVHSLRYALLILSFVAVWGAFHYWMAGKHLAKSAKSAAAKLN